MNFLGRHLLAEFYDCRGIDFNSVESVKARMQEAALAAKATIVESCFHHFSPHGVSGIVVIAESHLTIHTWPEHGYAAIDVFTCGTTCNPQAAIVYLQSAFKPDSIQVKEYHRGMNVIKSI